MHYMTTIPPLADEPPAPPVQFTPDAEPPWEGYPPREVRRWAVEQIMKALVTGNNATPERIVKSAAVLEAYVMNGAPTGA